MSYRNMIVHYIYIYIHTYYIYIYMHIYIYMCSLYTIYLEDVIHIYHLVHF